MTAYYNEFAAFPAQWLRNLAAAGHIAPGFVDDRSIKEVKPDDLHGYAQSHFFAGIGCWSYALRLAGWPDDREVWTGSCPCQPFSAAGKRGGTNDPRHLWPDWFRLIRECRPATIFGEQVASSDGLAWLDIVCTDLESEGYSVGAFDLCAAGAGAPHIRQRLYFVAHTNGKGQSSEQVIGKPEQTNANISCARSSVDILADAASKQMGHDGQSRGCAATNSELADTTNRNNGSGDTRGWSGGLEDGCELGDASYPRLERRQGERRNDESQQPAAERAGSFWSDLVWLPCRDGKTRPTKPGLFPLAARTPGRVGRLRAYGNAIVAPLAAEFIKAYMETQS